MIVAINKSTIHLSCTLYTVDAVHSVAYWSKNDWDEHGWRAFCYFDKTCVGTWKKPKKNRAGWIRFFFFLLTKEKKKNERRASPLNIGSCDRFFVTEVLPVLYVFVCHAELTPFYLPAEYIYVNTVCCTHGHQLIMRERGGGATSSKLRVCVIGRVANWLPV